MDIEKIIKKKIGDIEKAEGVYIYALFDERGDMRCRLSRIDCDEEYESLHLGNMFISLCHHILDDKTINEDYRKDILKLLEKYGWSNIRTEYICHDCIEGHNHE